MKENIHKDLDSIKLVAEHYANQHKVPYTVIKKAEFYEFVTDSYFENHKEGFEIIQRFDPTLKELEENFGEQFSFDNYHKYLDSFKITNPYEHFGEESRKNKSETLHTGYTYIKSEPDIGRNEPCKCGSGKKYKKCCISKKEVE